MKKNFILAAVLFLSLVFCTKDNQNPTDVPAKGYYTDSIVIDLFPYLIYSSLIDTTYFDSINITARGQPFVTPLDSIYKRFGKYPAIVPKYKPSRFEAWVYDSIPFAQTSDTLDPNLVARVYTYSSNYFYSIDTTSVNIFKGIQPIQGISYNDGYGFVLSGFMGNYWGIGKIKIYYR
jgi:hypothetical protein